MSDYVLPDGEPEMRLWRSMMVDDFAERIAAIAARKQVEHDKATQEAMEEQSNLLAARQRIIPVIDRWHKFIVPLSVQKSL